MAISDQPTQYIDKKIDWTTMPGVLNLGDVLELINDRFDDGALSQQQVFRQRHQAVLHVRAQLGYQANTEGIQQELKEWLGDIAFIAKQSAEQVFDQFRDWLAIIDIAWSEDHTEQLASIIDNQVQLETEEPTGRTLASLSEIVKYLVLLDTQVVTHSQGC